MRYLEKLSQKFSLDKQEGYYMREILGGQDVMIIKSAYHLSKEFM
jgi:hypothetical protein